MAAPTTDLGTPPAPAAPPTAAPWAPEDQAFWESTGKRVASRTLWVTTAALTLSFATWFMWSAIVVRLNAVGFHLSVGQQFWLVALPGLFGATLRIPYSFIVQVFGTRKVVTLATATLLVPSIGVGLAVQNTQTPYWVLLALAATAGFGGGNFSAFMSSTSLFFPKRKQGTALGLQAGLGNFGVSIVQFLTPLIVTAGLFGPFAGASLTFTRRGATSPMWLQNAAFVWVIPVLVTTVLAAVLLRDIPVRASVGEQAVIFRRKHTWVMTSLYLMTFGSFSGLAASTALLIGKVFSPERFADAPDPLAFAFLGPLIGSAVRPLGGWISDKVGGAKVTVACTVILIAATLGLTAFTAPTSMAGFPMFLAMLLTMFFAAGIGNGSTFRMIPVIFEPREAAPVLGWTAAVAAYGAFLLPVLLGWSLSSTRSPNAALYVLAVFYVANLALCAWYYARPGAEKPC